VAVSWNVSYSEYDPLQEQSLRRAGRPSIQILRGLSGRVEPGSVLAILGPSGSGKTSLLNCLAGKVRPDKIEGAVRYNGNTVRGRPDFVGLIEQADAFLPLLTVREHLSFHASLRLHHLAADARHKKVDEVLSAVGLDDCGDKRIMVLSGGQKKRLSICEELLADPKVLLLDEPTSQLDSHMAAVVVKELHNLAALKGTTIILTIHQPSSALFLSFQNVMILAHGTVFYAGAATGLADHLTKLEHVCPQGFSVAEHAMDVISGMAKEDFPAGSAKDLPEEEQKEVPKATVSRAPWLVEYAAITKRTFLVRSRQRLQTRLNILNTTLISLFAGTVYFQVGKTTVGEAAIRSRTGAMFFLLVHPVFSAIFETTMPLVMSAGTLMREYKTKRLYRVSSYYGALTFGELPVQMAFPLIYISIIFWMVGYGGIEMFFLMVIILLLAAFTGCSVGYFLSTLSNDFDIVMSISVVALVCLFLFSGMLSDSAQMPAVMQPIGELSLFKHAFDAGLVAIWRGVDIPCGDQCDTADPVSGAEVLATYGIAPGTEESHLMGALAKLCVISLVTRVLALLRLHFRYVHDDDCQNVAGGRRGAEEKPGAAK
jgi:ABC-type multidrug transport system ATPase subunit